MQILEQISTFTLNHWTLSLALLIVLILIFFEEIKHRQSGGHRLSPQTATYLINREHASIIDLRDKDLFEKGHISHAMHFSQSDIMNQLNKIQKLKNKPIILVDTTGHHSVLVRAKLQKEGFTHLYVLSGGINAWKEAGLPLTKKT